MLAIDLGQGAVAFEPDASDTFGSFDRATLRKMGWGESAIQVYMRHARGSLDNRVADMTSHSATKA